MHTVEFWLKSNRGTNESKLVRVSEKTTNDELEERLITWCKQFCAWHHSDNMVRYGWRTPSKKMNRRRP